MQELFIEVVCMYSGLVLSWAIPGWIFEASMHVYKNLCTKKFLIFTSLCLIIVSFAITVSPQNNQKSHSFYHCHS